MSDYDGLTVVDYIDPRLREAHLHVMVLIKEITQDKHSWNRNWDFADDLVIIYIDDPYVTWNLMIDLLLLNDGNVQYFIIAEKNKETAPAKIGKLLDGTFSKDFKELYEIAV